MPFFKTDLMRQSTLTACCLALFALLAATNLLRAQSSADSLAGMELLKKAGDLDSEGRYSEAIQLYQQSLPLFARCGYQKGYFTAKISIAYDHFDQSHYQQAKAYINETIEEITALAAGKAPLMKLGDAWLAKGNIHDGLYEIGPAIASFEAALRHYRQLPDKKDEPREKFMAFAHNNLGSIYLKARNFPKALEHTQTAWDLKKKTIGPTAQSTLNTIRIKAEIWLQMGLLNKALELQNEVLKIEKADKDLDGVAHCYREISKVYQQKRDYKTAEEYIRLAIDIYTETDAQQLTKMAVCEHQLGNVLKDGGRYAESIPWFESALKKHNTANGGQPNHESGIATMNIGKAHTYLKNYPKALDYYRRTWGIFKKCLDDTHPRYIELWLSMGDCYLEKGDRAAAHDLFQRAYFLAKKELPEQTYDRAKVCHALASTTPNTQQALAFCQEGLQEISTDFCAVGLFYNPAIEGLFHDYGGLILFQRKIMLLERAYHETCDPAYLHHALETARTASAMTDLVRQSFFTESAKKYLAVEARKIYEAGVSVAFHLQELEPKPENLEQAFQFMEKSRSLILLEELHKEAASQLVKIPDSLTYQRQVLRQEILRLETAFQTSKSDMAASQKINQQLVSAKQNFHELEECIAVKYPDIVRVKQDMEQVGLPEIKSKLNAGEVVLEYLITDDDLFLLKISNQTVSLSKAALPLGFQQQVIDFIQLLKDENKALNSGLDISVYQDFAKKNRDIARILLGSELNKKETNLLVIPDGWLSYLPYELLLTSDNFSQQKVDYSDLPYLFRQCPVRYAFSANLQFNRPDRPGRHNGDMLAFAPEYKRSANPELTTRGGFSKLTQTIEEVKNIQQLLSGTVVTGPQANEKAFKESAGRYGILHLDMHSFTDEDNPMVSGLIFSDNADDEDDVLRAYELQGMKLNAQLAVLSACNTGSGKLEKGEGVMNLGRGFRQAGVPNIVMSLWQVDDESTRQIMGSFYGHLMAGLSTDDALRQAKLDYLNGGRKTFPFFWSAFVLMGDNGGLTFLQKKNATMMPLSLGILGALLLGSGAWFFYKMQRR